MGTGQNIIKKRELGEALACWRRQGQVGGVWPETMSLCQQYHLAGGHNNFSHNHFNFNCHPIGHHLCKERWDGDWLSSYLQCGE